jgi:hypothetical protein
MATGVLSPSTTSSRLTSGAASCDGSADAGIEPVGLAGGVTVQPLPARSIDASKKAPREAVRTVMGVTL